MYKIDITNLNGNKTFHFNGAIDSVTSQEISPLLESEISSKDIVVFDFENVNYISSSGLRIVLKFSKIANSFECVNVSNDVYEIFDITGFTQIVKISKRMREVSIEGATKIGEGYMGKVFRLTPDEVIKVYHRNSGLEDIERERSLAKKAFVLGLPTAIAWDVVKVKEGGYGSVFELLNSKPLNELIIGDIDNSEKYINLYLDLLKNVNEIELKPDTDLPDKRKDAYTWLEDAKKFEIFEPRVLDKLSKLIDTIPDGNHLIHGDFHVKNIMMQGDEPLIIDMDTLGRGHEIFEISAFFLTYIGYGSTDPNNCKEFIGLSNEFCADLFYRCINTLYPNKTNEEKTDIVEKVALLSYMWLAQKTVIYESKETLRYKHAVEEVLKRVDKIDTLAF